MLSRSRAASHTSASSTRTTRTRGADRLAVQGDDVSVGGVATYSTLGHLPDPVFNTMLVWREPRLLGTIFHELAHEQLYVADDTEFNEAYASVVATAGIRRWYAARPPSPELAEWERQEVREREFAALLAAARGRLARLYASGAPDRGDADREGPRVRSCSSSSTRSCARAGAATRATTRGSAARSTTRISPRSRPTRTACRGSTRELEAAQSLQAFYGRAAELARLPRAERHALVCKGASADRDHQHRVAAADLQHESRGIAASRA